MFTIVDNLEKKKQFNKLFKAAEEEFLSMLPYERKPFHDFERYVMDTGNEKHFFSASFNVIDEIGDDYCLYHLYYLNEGDDTLRTTLIMPSNWDKRFEILEKSIENLKAWVAKQVNIKRVLIQSLESGKIEYYPTLSHYIIPVLIKAGFSPDYKMYMRWKEDSLPVDMKIPEGFSVVAYQENMQEKITEFYTQNIFEGYFSNLKAEDLAGQFKEGTFKKTARFLMDENGEIIGGGYAVLDPSDDVIVGNKIWLEDIAVKEEYNGLGLERYLVSKLLRIVNQAYPAIDVYTYMSRKSKRAIRAFQDNNFNGFEFWVDMYFNK